MDRAFIEAEFTPETYFDIENEVRKGCEAMFVHLFDTGDKETKFMLTLALMAQCTWYRETTLSLVSISRHLWQMVIMDWGGSLRPRRC